MMISDNRTIASIQEDFQAHFPNLKIEFYTDKHGIEEASPATQQLVDESQTIGVLRKIQYEGNLSINGHLKVTTLEYNFSTIYGLNVQVFRRSGGTWLQTSTTDNWTLSEQNSRAERYKDPTSLQR